MRPDEMDEEREVEGLLSTLDHPVPDISADQVVARARRDVRARVRNLRIAAGIVLVLAVGAGAAYAVPGSPLPGWLSELMRGAGPDDARPLVPSDGSRADSAGISIAPGEHLVIQFDERVLGGHVRILLSDENDEVVALAAAGTSRFASEPSRLLIEHPGPDTLQIRLPRSSPLVDVRVGERSVLRKEGPRVSTDAVALPGGGWLVRLGSGGGD